MTKRPALSRGEKTARLSGALRASAAAVLAAIAVALATMPASGKTQAVLNLDSEASNGTRRNVMSLTNTMPNGREVMLVISCRVDNRTNYGVALDFGQGAIWNIDGETVAISRDGGAPESRRMNTNEEFLVLGGPPAIATFDTLLTADRVEFGVRDTHKAAFDLTEVRPHVTRYRELCGAPRS